MTTFQYPGDFAGTLWNVLDGDLYVSFRGSDQTGLGSPQKPFKTLQKAIDTATPGQKIVAGSGSYSEELNGRNKSLALVADGFCNIQGNGRTTAIQNWGNASSGLLEGFGLILNGTQINGPIARVKESYLFLGDVLNFGGTFQNCLIRDADLNATFDTGLINCTLIDTLGYDPNKRFTLLKNCHFNSGVELDLNSNILQQLDYCNQEPGSQLIIDRITYLDQPNLNRDFPQYQANGIDVDAFNFFNGTFLEFTLQTNSPLVGTGEGGNFIGAFGVGRSVHSFNLSPNALLTDVVVDQQGNLCLSSNPAVFSGTLETDEIDLGDVQALGRIRLFSRQEFDTNGTFSVVDFDPANGNPDQLKFEMRWSNIPGEVTSLPYQPMIWNSFPTVDEDGNGNGSLDFNAETSEIILARYVQFRVTLRTGTIRSFLLLQNYFRLLQENNDSILIP